MRIKMSCCLVTLFCVVAPLSMVAGALAQEEGDEPRREYRIVAGPLGRALNQLATQSRVQILYEPELVQGYTVPALVGDSTLRDALNTFLGGTGLTPHYVNGDTIVLRRMAGAESSAREESDAVIHGTVTLPDGSPAAGATVVAVSSVESGERRTHTDEKGRYSLNDLTPGEYNLTFEHAATATQQHAVTATAGRENVVDVRLDLQEFEEEVVIVGSRLGAPVESALPERVISREEIERSGASSIAQVLSLLPEVSINNLGDAAIGDSTGSGIPNVTNATTVQLRGLPQGTTLVLVNGRRVGDSSRFSNAGLFDLSSLPLALVERIEVLPAGASAVHGGDGLGGVVNIVLREDASGWDVHLRQGALAGYDESRASVVWGKSWSRGSLTVTGSFADNGRLSESERRLTADKDFTRFGGLDLRTTAGNPANVYSLEGCPPAPQFCFVPLEQRGNLPGLDAPFASVPIGQDGRGLTPADFSDTAGSLNLSSQAFSLISPTEDYGFAVNGDYKLTRRLDLLFETNYSRRDSARIRQALSTSSGQFGLVRVSAANPFNPFGVDVGVDFRFEDDVFVQSSDRYWRSLLGLRGQGERWEWELAGWLSESRADTRGSIFTSTGSRLSTALASSDPALALNPFVGDGGPPGSAALLSSLLLPLENDFSSELRGVNAYIRGPVVKLPAGELRGLLGGEYQEQELSSGPFSVEGGDDSHAVFAELRVPLWAPQAAGRLERLALTGAFRAESSGRFDEDATVGTVGLEYRPLQPLLLRASYSTAFKPLLLFGAVEATFRDTTPFILITDPQFGGAIYLVGAVSGGGVPPGLKPETSTSRTLGVVISPTSSWRLSITAWDNELDDRLAGVAAQFLVDSEAAFPERVIRDPLTDLITHLDHRPININFTEVAGVDVAVNGRWQSRYGDFVPALAASYTYEYDEQIVPGAPVQDNLAVRGPTGWAPRWKVVPRLAWEYEDRAYAGITGRYVSAYDDSQPLDSGPDAGTLLTLGDFWQVDLNVELAVGQWFAPQSNTLSGTRLSVGAVNLFDRLPDYCNGCFRTGYDASQYDIRGRHLYTELRLSF